MFDFPKTAAPAATDAPIAGLTFESFNFDTTDFSTMLQETTTRIDNTVGDYRALMATVLTESAGVLNEGAQLIMEQANEDAPNKLIAALQKLKTYLINLAKNIISRIQTMITSNEKVLALRSKVADNGSVGKLTAELYDYHLDAVNLDALSGNWGIMFKNDLFDISGSYSPTTAEHIDAEVAKVQAAKHDDIVRVVAAKAVKGSLPEGELAKGIAKQLRGGGERKSVPFSLHFFDVLTNFGKLKESIQKSFTSMEKEVDLAMGIVKEKLGQVKKDAKTPEDKKHASGYVAYAIATRKALSAGLDGAVLLNNLKLQAAVQEANEAKGFIIKASHFKAVQEGAIEPFLPYLDLPDNDENSLSAVAGLNENATGFSW